MLASVVGLSTGPCSVMGCGAPVIPVVGLAFAGLSSGTLAFLAGLSRVGTLLMFVALLAAVVALGWRRVDRADWSHAGAHSRPASDSVARAGAEVRDRVEGARAPVGLHDEARPDGGTRAIRGACA